jgi:hypothetical protein
MVFSSLKKSFPVPHRVTENRSYRVLMSIAAHLLHRRIGFAVAARFFVVRAQHGNGPRQGI